MKTKEEPKAKDSSNRFASERGFTIVQTLVTVAIVAVISAFALMAVGSARASMRLTGSTREFAGYLEKARSNAIRRNGSSNVTIIDASSYSVTMDFDADGTPETRTIRLQDGVLFKDCIGISATFDWRGRIGGAIRFELQNDRGLVSDLQLSGSGDVTIGNEHFEDLEIGEVTLNSNVPGGAPTPAEETPPADPSPTALPDSSPTEGPSPTTDPTPPNDPNPTEDPTPTEDDPNPGSSPGPSPSASTSPSPPQGICTLTASSTVSVPKNAGSKVVALATVTNANLTVFTATRSGDVTGITPGSTTLSGNGTLTYTITYANGNNKSGTVTISSSCGNKTISVTID